MASVAPRSIDDIKKNLLNPALTSHFHVNIGLPFNDVGFRGFWMILVVYMEKNNKTS